MPTILYVASSGDTYSVDAVEGQSLMTAAVLNDVPGIIGECGGNASCATCHVWVRAEFVEGVGPPGDLEDDLLDLGVDERRDGSRLACQIVATAALDGVVVDVPPSQT